MESETTFVAPEGVYSVTEELKPPLLQTYNVASSPTPYPTKVSAAVVHFPPKQAGPGFAQLLGGGNRDLKREKEREKEKEKDKTAKEREDGISLSSSDTPEEEPTQESAPSSPHESRTIFSSSHPSINHKKKHVSRPKHNIRTTSSTFITRIQNAEGLTRALQGKQGDITFLFYNIAKSFMWIEASSKSKEPLSRITFSAFPTCHDVNPSTSSPDHMDVVIGFNTGDLVWLDPITSRYGRLNKQGCISSSPCTSVRWVPSSPTLFLVSHADGTIIVYDKEREDGTFTPLDPNSASHPWNPLDSIFVTMPPWHPVPNSNSSASNSLSSTVYSGDRLSGASSGGSGGGGGGGGRADKENKAAVRKNPVSHWRVSKRAVVDFVFSPDVKYVAAISEDGCLRVIDALAEQLMDCYASYFGALTCVAWSPDGRFILTGGQDDLLTLFSPWEQRLVARCQGHSSFVAAVAFDDLRCDGRTYRFGSVGEDNRLILWDFSSGTLHRPKATHHQRMSMSSTISLAFRRAGTGSALHLPSGPDEMGTGGELPKYHAAPSRTEVAVVQPVLIKLVEGDLLAGINFLPRALLTSTKTGLIKLWIRPLAHRSRHGSMKHHHRMSSSGRDFVE